MHPADHGMKFKVIKNRKGESILTIEGFQNEEDLQRRALAKYGSENDEDSDDDDKTLFINLNRVIKDQENP